MLLAVGITGAAGPGICGELGSYPPPSEVLILLASVAPRRWSQVGTQCAVRALRIPVWKTYASRPQQQIIEPRLRMRTKGGILGMWVCITSRSPVMSQIHNAMNG